MQVDTVLIKVSSRCNIDCSYCYVYHSGDTNWARLNALISPAVMDDFASSLKCLARNQDREFCTVLHGGEPLMLGASGLHRFLALLRSTLPDRYPISIQTNGTLISSEILDICSQFKTSLAVSIDGPPRINDRFRLDHKGRSTFDRVAAGIAQLEGHIDAGFLYAGLLAVVDPATNPAEVYGFFKDLNPPSVDFLYKDGNHSRLPPGKASVDSIEYGSWMVQILDLYLNDPAPIPIRVLDDSLRLLMGGGATKEGVGLSDFGILIFDTDGSITKNDTLKSAHDGADRFIKSWKAEGTQVMDLLDSDEYRRYHDLQRPTSRICRQCPELEICGGGMALHRWSDPNGYDNPSVYCADQLMLISTMRERLEQFEPTR